MKEISRGSGLPDNGNDPGESFCSSQLLLLSPLASESQALSAGLSRILGSPSRSSGLNETVFPPYVTVRFLGPGTGPAERFSEVNFSGYKKILIAGFAGGLSVRATAGKAFVVSGIFGRKGDHFLIPSSTEWSRLLGLETAVSVEVDKILERPGEKSALARQRQADLADMESYAWMKAILNNAPDAGVLRVVSDDRETSLPQELMCFSDETGCEHRIRGFASLLKRPVAMAQFLRAMPSLLRARATLVSIGEKLGTVMREEVR